MANTLKTYALQTYIAVGKCVKLTYTFTGNQTVAGSTPVAGRVYRVVTIPDATTVPTASWDLDIVDVDGGSIVGTQLANQSDTATMSTALSVPQAVGGVLSIVTTNAGSGKGTVHIWIGP